MKNKTDKDFENFKVFLVELSQVYIYVLYLKSLLSKDFDTKKRIEDFLGFKNEL